MTTAPAISFHDYVRLLGKSKDPLAPIDEYDDFLLKTWELFELRSKAEDYYRSHRHLAKNPRGPLPLPWHRIREVLSSSEPQESLVTLIAKRHVQTLEGTLSHLRKTLRRIRRPVSLENVQQLDAHCLRWLTRQPGRSAVEKGGTKQQILGVVREETFDTLENRVLKDFLSRIATAADLYLRKSPSRFEGHATILAVRRLLNLARRGAALPELRKVGSLAELPQPNFVLQQDRHYSVIWDDYCKLLRQEEIAETLWDNRKEILNVYQRIVEGIPLHCDPRAKFQASLWFNELDGRAPVLEAPWWDNVLATRAVGDPFPEESEVLIQGEVLFVDLKAPWDNRETLVYGTHKNAKPYLENPHKPNPEPFKEKVTLGEIIERRDSDRLQAYFEQLLGLVEPLRKGGIRKWCLLVSDSWDAKWLEQVIRAVPVDRSHVFLLWRSIATVLSLGKDWALLPEGSIVSVIDDELDHSGSRILYSSEIKLLKVPGGSRLIPQRASFRLRGENKRFRWPLPPGYRGGTMTLWGSPLPCRATWDIPPSHCAYADGATLKRGAERFYENLGKRITYYDELESLSLIVQDRQEHIIPFPVVEHDDRWEGGKPYLNQSPIPCGSIKAGEDKISLNFYEGTPAKTDRLKEYVQRFDCIATEATEVLLDVEMTPGQGLAQVSASSSILPCPVELDLGKLEESNLTILRLETEMKRHFPPDMPYVEASPELWQTVRSQVEAYLAPTTRDSSFDSYHQGYLPGKVFALARPYYEAHDADEAILTPVDRLKRENVFGNNPANRLPSGDARYFSRLFKVLSDAYRNHPTSDALRLIAWTYQYDNPDIDWIRNQLHNKYVNYKEDLTTIERTFCCNNFSGGDERLRDILEEALSRRMRGVDDSYRLIYNLLQFNPQLLERCSSALCEETLERFISTYNENKYTICVNGRTERWRGGDATKFVGYLLKCMLFILHRRRYDPDFYRRKGWHPAGFLAESLEDFLGDIEGYRSSYLRNYGHEPPILSHEQTRKAFIKYVNGEGSLDGIPAIE